MINVENVTKICIKNIKIQHQLIYLRSAVQQQFLPRGIGDQIKFTTSIHDSMLQGLCQNIMYFAGSRILDLLIIYYSKWHNNLNATYYTEVAKLQKSLNKTSFDNVMASINKRMQKEVISCNKTHQSKLIRDRDILKYPYLTCESNTYARPTCSKTIKQSSRRLTKHKQKCRNKKRAIIKGDIPSLDNIPHDKLKNSVINLSTKIENISSHQLLLFFLGKSFAPTPSLPDYSQFRMDILQFAYRLRWAWYWHKNPKPVTEGNTNYEIQMLEKKLIDKKVTKQIRSSDNHCLELFITKVSDELLQSVSKTKKKLPDNIPTKSRQALDEMKNWKDVIIRPADKGSTFFIMDRSDYVLRTLEHLSDPTTFVVIKNKHIAINQVVEVITQWTQLYDKEPGMTSSVKKCVIPDEYCKPGNNYINPKAHKPEKNYVGRLISTGCASHTKNLAALTAIELNKVELKYIIKDTNHLLRKIKDINEQKLLHNKDVIHVSFDVVNMFPSISKSVGLEQCRQHLDKRDAPLFSTNCIIDALEITLNHNLTEFEGVVYKQIKGTAMGPKNACAYADVAMNSIDVMVNEGNWDQNCKPVLWGRFRDDIYVPWTFGLDKLHSFHEFLNSKIPGIKFTMAQSSQGIEFLDTYIYMHNGELHTKPYSKPCDDHTFLVPSSCHPSHTLRNIPYSIAHRLYRIASEPAEYLHSKLEFTEHLKARGYSIRVIHEAFEKLEQKDRELCIGVDSVYEASVETVEKRVLPLVCEFNPGLPNVGGVLAKHKHILSLDDELLKVINPDKIFASYRGAKTIQDLLIHSKLPCLDVVAPEEVEFSGKCQPCSKTCVLCKNYLKTTSHVTSCHTSSTYPIKDEVDCNTKTIVYIISDLTCSISYIGCTSDSAKVRFGNHKSHIKHGHKTCELSKHFLENPHLHPLDKSTNANFDKSLRAQLELTIIEKVKISGNNLDSYSKLNQCKVRECFWQNKLRTMKDYGGLNVREERNTNLSSP